jgi:stage IV sporulation protein FB
VADAVECLLRTTQEEFPVVDGWGRPAGILTRPDLIIALRNKGEGAAIMDVMAPPSDPLQPGEPLAKALEALQASGRLALPVVEAEGRLIGLLTSANVAEMMMVRAARPDFQFRRSG